MATRESLLFGRSRAVSLQLVLLAVGLGALLTATFYTDVNTLWPAPLVESGVLLLVALAAIEAYYNEGLLVAWLLTFAAVVPAVIFHPPRGPMFAVTPATAPVAVAKAGGVAAALGTIGFVIGAALRHRQDGHRTDTYTPSPTVLPAVCIGRTSSTAVRSLLFASGEFVVLFVGVQLDILPFGFGLGGVAGIVVMLALMSIPGVIYAARNSGLLVCWGLAFAPLFGVFLALQLGFVGEVAPDRPVLYALGSSLLFSIPVGTAAFLLGLSGRRVRHRVKNPLQPTVDPE